MMALLKILFAVVVLPLALAATGCDSERGCDDPQCGVIRDRDLPEPDTHRPPPDCLDACKNALGDCGAITAEVDDCTRQCRSTFTEDEAACLAGLSCGEATDACFGS